MLNLHWEVKLLAHDLGFGCSKSIVAHSAPGVVDIDFQATLKTPWLSIGINKSNLHLGGCWNNSQIKIFREWWTQWTPQEDRRICTWNTDCPGRSPQHPLSVRSYSVPSPGSYNWPENSPSPHTWRHPLGSDQSLGHTEIWWRQLLRN